MYGGPRQATDDNIIRCMGFECWINKATYAHAHARIHTVNDFLRQEWLRAGASLLRYTYSASVVYSNSKSDVIELIKAIAVSVLRVIWRYFKLSELMIHLPVWNGDVVTRLKKR